MFRWQMPSRYSPLVSITWLELLHSDFGGHRGYHHQRRAGRLRCNNVTYHPVDKKRNQSGLVANASPDGNICKALDLSGDLAPVYGTFVNAAKEAKGKVDS